MVAIITLEKGHVPLVEVRVLNRLVAIDVSYTW